MSESDIIDNIEMINGLCNETLFGALSDAIDELGIFVTDMETGETFWSESAISFFNFPEDYHDNFEEMWFTRIHPDDLPEYKKELLAVLQGEKDIHYSQFRALIADGQYVWVRCKGSVVIDKLSKKRFFIGYVICVDRTGIYDRVTGCLNLSEFYNRDFEKEHIFILVGMDSFRKIINRIGFAESNNILQIMGLVLKRLSPTDSVFRMTGDEFLVVAPVHSAEYFERVHERVHYELKKEVERYFSDVRLHFSAVGTHYDPATDSKESVLHRLEHTLEYVKQYEKGRFKMYSADIEKKHDRASKIQGAMTKAIENNFEGFYLTYQPVICTDTHKLNGAEALLRFKHAELGVISPVEFIPMLEASGEIHDIGLWVAEQVIAQKVIWDSIYPGLRLGFNTSMMQYSDETLPNRIIELMDLNNLDYKDILVELTESQRMTDPEHLKKMLQPLVDKNICIYLDDFGMEESSFTLVQELPIRGVKIDHSFVRTMIGNENPQKDRANIAIISSINHLANQLGLRVVAEGVENKQIDSLLADMNIQFVQGFYYSRPVPVEEFEEQLRKDKPFIPE